MKKYIIISLFLGVFSSFNALACATAECDHDSDCNVFKNESCGADQRAYCVGAKGDPITHKKTGCKGSCVCENKQQ